MLTLDIEIKCLRYTISTQKFLSLWSISVKVNKFFASKFNFSILISFYPEVVDLSYSQLWILLGQIVKVLNIKCVHHQVSKVLGFENLSLSQQFSSFESLLFDLSCRSIFHLKDIVFVPKRQIAVARIGSINVAIKSTNKNVHSNWCDVKNC